MKPKSIFLIRHGQSEGNVNMNIYKEKPDYAVHLTEVGRKQAHECGKKLNEIVGPLNQVKFYVSPFWRTRETALEIAKHFKPFQLHPFYEDPRLREQEWGHKGGKAFNMEYERERSDYGHFYWRFPEGESCADVYDRVSDFMNTLHRDFEKNDFPENAVIVTHGMAMRLFLMRWFHKSVEEFESWGNPKNCQILTLKKQYNGKYELLETLRTHVVHHPYQFPEYKTLPL
jgi:broad specificity phosphatase PhoE